MTWSRSVISEMTAQDFIDLQSAFEVLGVKARLASLLVKWSSCRGRRKSLEREPLDKGTLLKKAIVATKILGYLRVPAGLTPPKEIEEHLGCWVYPDVVKKGGYQKHGIGRIRNRFVMDLNRVHTLLESGEIIREDRGLEAKSRDLLKGSPSP